MPKKNKPNLLTLATALDAHAQKAGHAALAAGAKTVAFACSKPLILSVQIAGQQAIFPNGSGAASFPSGNSILAWRVKGPSDTPFTITVTGAVMEPIASRIRPGQSVAGGLIEIEI